MRDSNLLLGKNFAKKFNKKYGIITYSGTLAIEIALKSLNLKKKSKILVISEVCYSIVNTIIKLGYIPIILKPENDLYLIEKDIEKILSVEDIKCILLVHQYGILNDFNLNNKKLLKNIKIIEDIAQAWDIGSSNYQIGKYSDIVITSFGKTKALSYGIGGGIFFDDESIFHMVDFCDNESREENNIMYSYAYPLCEQINYEELSEKANLIVAEQRKNALKYYDFLKNQRIFKFISYENMKQNVWHRFPVWVEDKNQFYTIINYFKNNNFEYQLQHSINLEDLSRNHNCIFYNYSNSDRYYILFRTRNIDIQKQIYILEELIRNIK